MKQSVSELIPQNTKRSLPPGWRWVRLEEVARVFAGSAAPQGPEYFSQDGPPFTRVSDLGVGKRTNYLLDVRDRLSARALRECSLVLAKKGTVLFPKSGAAITTNNRAVLGMDSYIVSHLMAIEPTERTTSDWLYFSLCQLDMMDYSDNDAYPSLKQSTVEKIEIPIPPLSEQKRIAAILTRQMAAVEQAKAAAEAQLQAANALRDACLCTVFISPQSKQWPYKRLGEIALLVQNGIYKTANNYGKGHPFLRMYNIPNDSWNLTLHRLAQIALEGNEQKTFGLRTGDLLVSRVNSFELVGKCAWVGPLAEGYVFENMLIRIRLNDSADSLFVAQQMSTPAIREQVERVAKRAIGQASINSEDIRGIKIAFPSLAEQKKIAESIDEKMVVVQRTSKALEDQLATINNLPAALLRRAFGGDI